ncbi:hypothetical protein ACFOJE_05510 [Azotobacter bryophylli]|uniref:Uncharacterized protein n=1 Tax=Azotobacter bryophylli TaxID=1986537 RepID=A0ABV7AQX5_9GAMM
MAGSIRPITRLASAGALVAGLQLMGGTAAHAFEVYSDEESKTKLDAKLSAVYGFFSSQKSYNGFAQGQQHHGRTNWHEGYAKYGVYGETGFGLPAGSTIYGGLSAISSGTWGDGDAGGFSSGHEYRTAFEETYGGWKSGNLFPFLGENGLDISGGSQNLVIGKGFIINNDMFQYGDTFGKSYDRGGMYYLSGRSAFDKTAVVRVGGASGPRGEFAWVKSDNMGQGAMEFALANLEYNAENSSVAFMYLKGIDVSQRAAREFADYFAERDGMDLYNLRGSTNAGIENLTLDMELVYEDKVSDGFAGYAAAAYDFADVAWTPRLSYRYSRFSKHYDALFFGYQRYGTWWQGEVAGDYSGPYNMNSDIHQLSLLLHPHETVTLGANAYHFHTIDSHQKYAGNNVNASGDELDLYMEWAPTPTYYVAPLLGLYKPHHDRAHGGTQNGDNNLNVYLQMIVGLYF